MLDRIKPLLYPMIVVAMIGTLWILAEAQSLSASEEQPAHPPAAGQAEGHCEPPMASD
jgi:hypothetical protein